MKDALQTGRGAQSLDSLGDDYIGRLWVTEARTRRDDVRSGSVATIAGQEALAQVRKSVIRGDSSFIR